jgi:uncharacterized membrane protein
MLGYDWPELHATLNDLPAVLLLMSVGFDLLAAITRRESLRAVGFWTLIVGVVGTAAAVGAGLIAEDRIDHSDRAHAIMETHETLAIIVLVLFGLLALWRLVRRGVWGPREQPIALTAGVIGVALMVYTAKLGGDLVFDHALGIRTDSLQAIVQERTGGHSHEGGEEHEHAPADSARADTMGAAADTGRTHTHDDSTSHRH